MPRVAVVVPWRGGCPHRERAWTWIRARYAAEHPDWRLIEAPGPEPWVKAAAVMPAVAASRADIVVIADADCWTDGLHEAVRAVLAGESWAVPHRAVHRLSEGGTANVLAGIPPAGQPLEQRPYLGVETGGITVLHREFALSVPMDARFVGWGQEDESWGMALRTLLGPPWRGSAPLWHLWHPPQERATRRRGSEGGWVLRCRYALARGDVNLMRHLVEEGRNVLLHERAA